MAQKDVNKCGFTGRLAGDPEVKAVGSEGTTVTTFTMAVAKPPRGEHGEEQEPNWLNFVAWNKLAETIANHCRKGMRIYVEARANQRKWDDGDGNKRSSVEFVVTDMIFLEAKRRDEDADGEEEYQAPRQQARGNAPQRGGGYNARERAEPRPTAAPARPQTRSRPAPVSDDMDADIPF